MSTSTSLTLLSLNDDVLREILAYVLLDTPCEPNRAAMLRTCSLLHNLGLPFIYRVVELRNLELSATVERHWTSLFSPRGLFAEGGTAGGQFGRFVRELRLRSSRIRGANIQVEVSPALRLPSCSFLLLDLDRFLMHYLISSAIISQLPVTRLVLAYPAIFNTVSGSFGEEFGANVLGVIRQPPAWDCLETIVFDDRLWYDDQASAGCPSLALSSWSFKTLIVRVDTSSVQPWDLEGEGFYAAKLFLFGPTSQFTADAFLPKTVRVEIRLHGSGAVKIEEAFRAEVDKHIALGLSAFETRVAKMIVFVGENGEERKLIEGV